MSVKGRGIFPLDTRPSTLVSLSDFEIRISDLRQQRRQQPFGFVILDAGASIKLNIGGLLE
jgi:hypothetical protein